MNFSGLASDGPAEGFSSKEAFGEIYLRNNLDLIS